MPDVATAPERLWSRRFALTLAAQFLAYANNLMIGPVLPLYLASLGGGASLVGLTFAAFSVASFAPRPLVGQAVDRWTPRGVYALGGLALMVSSLGYLAPVVGAIVGWRALHGLGWAAINTAGVTIASEVTPPARRGAAVGYLGTAQNAARTILPAAGLWLLAAAGFGWVFVVSAALGCGAALFALLIRVPPRPGPGGGRGPFWASLIEARALVPSGIFALHSTGAQIVAALVTLYALERGFGDLTLYFILGGLAAVAGTLLAPLSDRFGRVPVAAVGFGVSALGLAAMLFAQDGWWLVAGSVLWNGGSTLVQPALLALTIDRTPAARRGAGVATFTGAFQVGSGGGGLLWGLVIDGFGFVAMFVGCIALTIAGLGWLLLARPRPAGSA